MFIKSKNSSAHESGGPMQIFWGQSTVSYSDAVQLASTAAKTALPGATFEWLEVAELRGGYDSEQQIIFQVAIRVGYIA